jgi:hypothetical protein
MAAPADDVASWTGGWVDMSAGAKSLVGTGLDESCESEENEAPMLATPILMGAMAANACCHHWWWLVLPTSTSTHAAHEADAPFGESILEFRPKRAGARNNMSGGRGPNRHERW